VIIIGFAVALGHVCYKGLHLFNGKPGDEGLNALVDLGFSEEG